MNPIVQAWKDYFGDDTDSDVLEMVDGEYNVPGTVPGELPLYLSGAFYNAIDSARPVDDYEGEIDYELAVAFFLESEDFQAWLLKNYVLKG